MESSDQELSAVDYLSWIQEQVSFGALDNLDKGLIALALLFYFALLIALVLRVKRVFRKRRSQPKYGLKLRSNIEKMRKDAPFKRKI